MIIWLSLRSVMVYNREQKTNWAEHYNKRIFTSLEAYDMLHPTEPNYINNIMQTSSIRRAWLKYASSRMNFTPMASPNEYFFPIFEDTLNTLHIHVNAIS